MPIFGHELFYRDSVSQFWSNWSETFIGAQEILSYSLALQLSYIQYIQSIIGMAGHFLPLSNFHFNPRFF